MYYEINVSLNGRHFFATSERSVHSFEQAKNMYNLFLEKFPESEGYKIDVFEWNTSGKIVKFN